MIMITMLKRIQPFVIIFTATVAAVAWLALTTRAQDNPFVDSRITLIGEVRDLGGNDPQETGAIRFFAIQPAAGGAIQIGFFDGDMAAQRAISLLAWAASQHQQVTVTIARTGLVARPAPERGK